MPQGFQAECIIDIDESLVLVYSSVCACTIISPSIIQLVNLFVNGEQNGVKISNYL